MANSCDNNTIPKSSLSDMPFSSEINDFGTERYVNGLIKFIENSSAPITIALQGEWGSGKTSLMNRLKHALCSENGRFIGIEINTWEYSMLSSPEMTVFRIIERLTQSLAGNNEKAKNTFKAFSKRLVNFAYKGVIEGAKGISPFTSAALGVVNLPTKLIKEENDDVQTTLSDLRESLEGAVAHSLEGDKRGVVVFVDDLDRLNPPVAVEILELLKNIFCLKGCIFVLAIDYEVVVKGLEPKFGKLTDKNEREFRSFFDKIIQVPFSLPVNSYRPMNFVLDSLANIGYISDGEKFDARLKEPFKEIVDYSVGKNPRSIKRLINTLSLLSCIAQCGEDEDSEFTSSPEGRIANFAIVALQVCYLKVYRMLALYPDFTKWDELVAKKFNIAINKDEESDLDWETILESACSSDKYLEQHYNDIRSLLNLIQHTLECVRSKEVSFEERIRSITDKSTVTGLSEPAHTTDVDRKRLIDKLHNAVTKRVKEKRKDIVDIWAKKNTGNGGFNLTLPNNQRLEIKLRPTVLSDKISCEIILSTKTKRPDNLMDISFKELQQNENIAKMFSEFDKVIAPLLQNVGYLDGNKELLKNDEYFGSFAEETAFLHAKTWIDRTDICLNTQYWINLASESMFEDKAVVDTIADIVIANYDLRVAALDLERKS